MAVRKLITHGIIVRIFGRSMDLNSIFDLYARNINIGVFRNLFHTTFRRISFAVTMMLQKPQMTNKNIFVKTGKKIEGAFP